MRFFLLLFFTVVGAFAQSTIPTSTIRINADTGEILGPLRSSQFFSANHQQINVDIQAYDPDLTTWAGITPASGIGTFLGTPTSANLASAVTNETGSGLLVFGTSPTLTTPNLGTPSALTLTNATGLPVSTGIGGLGAGVAAWLATPSSANLASAVTDETGTGGLVFANGGAINPTSTGLTTPGSGAFTALSSTGNIQVGSNSTSATATPLMLNMGGTYGTNTPGMGGNLKWRLYDDGASNLYGIGMSGGLMEFQSGGAGEFGWYRRTAGAPTSPATQLAYLSQAGVFSSVGGISTTSLLANSSGVQVTGSLSVNSLPVPSILSSTSGINAKTVANTALYTVPTGKTCVVTAYHVRVTAASAITTGPSAGVGNASGTNNIAASQAMTALTATTTTGSTSIFSWPIVGMASVTPAAGVIYLNLGTAAAGTSETLTVDLIGYTF